jgi:hypothetical protein
MTIKEVSHKTIVSDVLSAEVPALVLFYNDEKNEDFKKIEESLTSIMKDLPKLPVYKMHTEKDENDADLSKNLGIKFAPVLVVFKNGEFNRYKYFTKKERPTKKTIMGFIGKQVNMYKTEEQLAQENASKEETEEKKNFGVDEFDGIAKPKKMKVK